jgi:hypothetical protein
LAAKNRIIEPLTFYWAVWVEPSAWLAVCHTENNNIIGDIEENVETVGDVEVGEDDEGCVVRD